MDRQIQDVYIAAITRTPVAKAEGAFRHTRPDDLLADVIKGALQQVPSLDTKQINDVIIGCAMPEGPQGMNVARISTLLAGLPNTTPAMTINRFCSSGVQSLILARDQIALGYSDVVLAGGIESMTMVPMGGYQYRANENFFNNDEEHVGIAYSMGITAENVSKQWNISREQQDAFALESHRRALSAIDKGLFSTEITPIDIKSATPNCVTDQISQTEITIRNDEGPRADTSAEKLAKLRPVFSANGTVTAGNSSQRSDGAAIAVLVSEKALKQFNLTPISKIHGYQVVGVAPELMGIGPCEAIKKALIQSNLQLADLDWIELNEAFAAQALAVIKDAGLDPEKVNPLGGAIALGHPLGATGAIRAATLVHGLKQRKQKYGMVTMCIGTGMGAAGIFEVM